MATMTLWSYMREMVETVKGEKRGIKQKSQGTRSKRQYRQIKSHLSFIVVSTKSSVT